MECEKNECWFIFTAVCDHRLRGWDRICIFLPRVYIYFVSVNRSPNADYVLVPSVYIPVPNPNPNPFLHILWQHLLKLENLRLHLDQEHQCDAVHVGAAAKGWGWVEVLVG